MRDISRVVESKLKLEAPAPLIDLSNKNNLNISRPSQSRSIERRRPMDSYSEKQQDAWSRGRNDFRRVEAN